MIGIYKITSPSKRIYIGQSIDIEKRFSYYKRIACKAQTILYRSLTKYGVDKHKFEILCECEISELNDKERYYQDLYSAIGTSGMNCKLTKSTDRSGETSIETKLKNSISSKNYIPTLETRKKISLAHLGKKLTEDCKVKLSISKIGNKNPMFGKTGENHHSFGKKWTHKKKRKTRKVIDEKTGIIYDSIKIASECLNIKESTFNKYILGYNKNILNFKYYD